MMYRPRTVSGLVMMVGTSGHGRWGLSRERLRSLDVGTSGKFAE
jgi:hypothetical protein